MLNTYTYVDFGFIAMLAFVAIPRDALSKNGITCHVRNISPRYM